MLLRFLQDWFKWAESGGHSTMFRKDHGLCGALSYWCMYVERCSDDKALKGARRLRWLLAAQYPSYREVGAEQNSSCYPFGGKACYHNEEGAKTMHLNPERFAWVVKTIKELETECPTQWQPFV